MRKLIFYIFIINVIFISCNKREIPGAEDIKNHPILWEDSIPSLLPYYILDEYDNLYFTASQYNGSTELISYNKNEKIRWRKTFNHNFNKTYCNNTFFIYSDYKSDDSSGDEIAGKLLLLNPDNGEINNELVLVTDSVTGVLVDISKKEILVLRKYDSISYLSSYSYSLEENWTKGFNINVKSMRIIEDKLVVFTDNKFITYSLLDNGFEFDWEIVKEGLYMNTALLVDNYKNYYLNYIPFKVIFVISPEGEELKTIEHNSTYLCGFTRDNSLVMKTRNIISVIDQNSSKKWETEIDMIKNEYPEILVGENGKLYIGSVFGVYSLFEDSGEQDWHIGMYQGISQVGAPKINSKGNLVFLSFEGNKIYCVKGD